MGATQFLAGTSEAVITAPLGLSLVGTLQPGTGVHDDLWARALVLGDGVRTAAIVCLDLCVLDFELADRIRAQVHRQTGIAVTMLNCTHTHSAPATSPRVGMDWGELEPEGRAWRDAMVGRIADAVSEAVARLRPAVLRVGRAPVQVGLNRRLSTEQGIVMKPNPTGAVAPWVDVLRVDALDGSPTALLFSHAAHPVIIHGASSLLGADYPGYAIAEVRKCLGNGVTAIFAQACGANINGEPLRGGFEAAERAGIALAEAAVKAASASEPLTPAGLETRSMTFHLPFREFPPAAACEAELGKAQARLAQAQDNGDGNKASLAHLQYAVQRLSDLVQKARRAEPQQLRFETSALTVGREWCLLAMTHEVFVEYQLWAEQVLPFRHKMTFGYTNGCESYIPTDADFALGGYETAAFPAHGAALSYPTRVALQPAIEQRIKNAIGDLWGQTTMR